MSGTSFYKMTGSGNDFVMLDGRNTTTADWSPERIAAVCDRRNGAGADGLVILTPDGSETVRMAFWNCDGSPAAMCGNAALCSTRFAAHLGLAPAAGMKLATGAGTFPTRCVGAGHDAELNLPDFDLPAPVPGMALAGGERWIVLARVGVPHLVSRGSALRHHPAVGPAGANANFVSEPAQPGGPWLIRTFERGVEGETLACGTGTVASAVALAARGEAQLPLQFQTRSGRPLRVSAVLEAGKATQVWLRGEGRLVYQGVLSA
jgi:diaminopimelate epimerase